MTKLEYRVLISYDFKGVSVSQSLYTGPHMKHAHKAYNTAHTLALHGCLVNCKIRFFDGYKLRSDWEQDSNTLAATAHSSNLVTVNQMREATGVR